MVTRELATIFKALANERRLTILKILLKEKELSVSDISEKIGLSYKSTSKHLILLERAGFLRYRVEQIYTFYLLNSSLDKTRLQLLEIVKKNS